MAESNINNETIEIVNDGNNFINAKLSSTMKGDVLEESILFCDLAKIIKRHELWNKHLPNIKPFYAVKCNNDLLLLKCLVNLGTGFDCASKPEIKTILDLGIQPSDIVFANPCKPQSHIKYAAKCNVSKMTFDNEAELHKIATHFPSAQLIIRIRADDENALVKLGVKFGCSLEESFRLLQVARSLGLRVIGVSFHVGSGCQSPVAYKTAIQMSHQVFKHAETLGFEFTLLDIGGGFPGHESLNDVFIEVACTVSNCISTLVTNYPNLTVIAEPGRFFAASCLTLATQVISKRTASYQDTMYYINDGVYGTFSGIMYENAVVQPQPLKVNKSGKLFPCSIWGPTCDSVDKIGTFVLPEMDIKDWILFHDMGAYSIVSCTGFNGFGCPNILYYYETPRLVKAEPLVKNGKELNTVTTTTILPIIYCS